MLNTEDEFLGIDKSSGFALRVLILSFPAGLIFLILGIFDILSVPLASLSYICILFFNTVYLMPISAELQQIKKYILALSSGQNEEKLLKSLTEKETRNLTEAINSMHRFWIDKTDMLEKRTLSDAAVLDTLPAPLLIVNRSGEIIGANLAARNLFTANINGKNISEFIADAKFENALTGILTGRSRHEELNLCLAERRLKPKFFLRISTIPWFAKGDIVAVISFYDLQKALQFEQMQQDFVANASHELRTPLSIIAGFVETLQTSAKNDEKAREKFLRIIQEQINFMSSLIENLLSLSRIELATNTPPSEKIAVNAILREIKTTLEIKFRERRLSFTGNFERLPQIIADKKQITQVLQNLLDNAVKYADEDTVISVSSSKVAAVPPHKYYDVAGGPAVKISISNTGITIPAEDLERLTERFYRLQEHKNRNIHGTGLGLSIVAGIIRRHHGNMTVTSENGLTTFSIFLPVSQNNSI